MTETEAVDAIEAIVDVYLANRSDEGERFIQPGLRIAFVPQEPRVVGETLADYAASGGAAPIAVETFHALRDRQTSDTAGASTGKASRVNLLNWDGKGTPEGLFPPRPTSPPEDPEGRS